MPGGTYDRTYTNTGSGPTGMADPATVSSLRLDKYLVTVGRFRQFVTAWNNAAGYLPAAGSGKHSHLNGGQGLANSGGGAAYEPGWDAMDWNNTTDVDPTNANLACAPPYDTWTDTATTQENLPINCANWWEAYAFCIWDGGFLPSEAEWEYAAAGGSEQLEYPWGSAAPGEGDAYAIYGWNYTGNTTDIAPVGYASRGVARWGQLDMAGEVWEWNLDWYAPYTDCADCADTTPATYRVFRGGNFSFDDTYLLPPSRYYVGNPAQRFGNIGFRCARAP